MSEKMGIVLLSVRTAGNPGNVLIGGKCAGEGELLRLAGPLPAGKGNGTPFVLVLYRVIWLAVLNLGFQERNSQFLVLIWNWKQWSVSVSFSSE